MLTIRKSTINQCQLIHDMAEVVFRNTYKEILSAKQIEYMMEWMYSPENIVKQIVEENHVYFICYKEEKACGYISIQQEENDLYHIQKIYIMPDYQGKQIGRKLFEETITYIKNIHPTPFRLELNVNRNNPAKKFYECMGMKIIREDDFPIGNGFYMNDYIMGIVIE